MWYFGNCNQIVEDPVGKHTCERQVEMQVRQGQDDGSGEVWRQVKKMKLSFEHDHVCIRHETGFLIWSCKTDEFDVYGFDMAEILETALINLPPEA